MKTWLAVGVAVALVSLLAGGAFAQMGGGHMGPGMTAPGTMGPAAGCPGMDWSAQGQAAAQITPDGAKQAAQRYADQYLKGYTVDNVLPFTGMGGMTMYSVELRGPKDEGRTLHVNPWGNVMPFGGPWRRAG